MFYLKRLKNFLIFIVVAVFAVALISYSDKISSAVYDALLLATNTLIPSLFPFMVFSIFIARSPLEKVLSKPLGFFCEKFLHLPACAASAVIFGFIGGYPTAANLVGELYKDGSITKNQGEHLISFATCASPAFVVSGIGVGIFGSVQIGFALLLGQFIASIATMILFRPKKQAFLKPKQRSHSSYADAFVIAVNSSATAVIALCAFVLTFSAFSQILESTGIESFIVGIFSTFGFDSEVVSTVMTGVLEVTSGCFLSLSIGYNGIFLSAFFMSICSLSIIFQIKYFSSSLSLKTFMIARLVHSVFSTVITYIIVSSMRITVPTMSGDQSSITNLSGSITTTVLMFFLCLFVITSTQKHLAKKVKV